MDEAAPPASACVRVCVRIRPVSQQEASRGDGLAFQRHPHEAHTVQTTASMTVSRTFAFDMCLDDSCNQEDVFSCCSIESLLQSVTQGYFATIFAYGVTGSGKTYTMTGNEDDSSTHLGLVPRSCRALFDILDAQTTPTNYFRVQASYLEAYNERVYDLLNYSESQHLPVRWSAREGFFVEGLILVECRSHEDLQLVVREGLSNRRVASNQVNRDSSRSHSMFTIYVESRSVDPSDGTIVSRFGKIHFVDLAGSERLSDAHFEDEAGRTLMRETQHINKSLFTLGKVISILGDPQSIAAGSTQANYVPYRDSVLTKLLMDSLGGSSRTLMIACISPASSTFEETLNTLSYAARARNIRNKPAVHMDPREQLIEMLRGQIRMLQAENAQLRAEASSGVQFLSVPHPHSTGSLPSSPFLNPHQSQPFGASNPHFASHHHSTDSAVPGSASTALTPMSAGGVPSKRVIANPFSRAASALHGQSHAGGATPPNALKPLAIQVPRPVVNGSQAAPMAGAHPNRAVHSAAPSVPATTSSPQNTQMMQSMVDKLVQENEQLARRMDAMHRQMEEVLRENDGLRNFNYIPKASASQVREAELEHQVAVLRSLLGDQKLREVELQHARDSYPPGAILSSAQDVQNHVEESSSVDVKRKLRLLTNENQMLRQRILELERQAVHMETQMKGLLGQT